MKMSLKYLFIGIIAALTLAMVIHVTVMYVQIANDLFSSVTPDVAFFLLIPYGIALAVCGAAWATANKIITNKNKRDAEILDKSE